MMLWSFTHMICLFHYEHLHNNWLTQLAFRLDLILNVVQLAGTSSLGIVSIQSTINSSLHDTFSLLMSLRSDKLPAIPVLSMPGDSQVAQKLSIDLSPFIFEPCQICFRGLQWKKCDQSICKKKIENIKLSKKCHFTKCCHAIHLDRWSYTIVAIDTKIHHLYQINLSTNEISFRLWCLKLEHPNGHSWQALEDFESCNKSHFHRKLFKI